MSVVKQLCVNRLKLPYEIIILIKDYAFNDNVIHKQKINKNIINLLIKELNIIRSTTGNLIHYSSSIIKDIKCPQLQFYICNICGEYIELGSINRFGYSFIFPAINNSDIIWCNC